MNLTVHIDGGARGNPGPAGAGVVVHDARGTSLLEAGFFLGHMTNNQAEYRALLRGLEAIEELEAEHVTICSDSELVVRQLTGEYRVKSPELQPLFEQAQQALLNISSWQIRRVPREQMRRADELANRSMNLGRHVIEVDLGKRRTQGVGPSETEVVAPTSGAPAVLPLVVARAVDPPDRAVCPAPFERDAEWRFGVVVPGGLCVNAAHSLLQTVLALQHTPSAEADVSASPMMVRCIRADCNAVFELRCEQ